MGWLCIVVILMCIFYLINAMNLTLFAKVYKKDYTLKQGIVNAMAGIFFNGITPMASGGQFYQVYAFNKQGIKADLLFKYFVNDFYCLSKCTCYLYFNL